MTTKISPFPEENELGQKRLFKVGVRKKMKENGNFSRDVNSKIDEREREISKYGKGKKSPSPTSGNSHSQRGEKKEEIIHLCFHP